MGIFRKNHNKWIMLYMVINNDINRLINKHIHRFINKV